VKETCDKMIQERITELKAHYNKHVGTLLGQIGTNGRTDIDSARVVVTYLIMHWAKGVSCEILDLYLEKESSEIEEWLNKYW
jgi:hypothetical protein